MNASIAYILIYIIFYFRFCTSLVKNDCGFAFQDKIYYDMITLIRIRTKMISAMTCFVFENS